LGQRAIGQLRRRRRPRASEDRNRSYRADPRVARRRRGGPDDPQGIGTPFRPDLFSDLLSRIHERGPLTAAAFMDLVLYDPAHGYYTRTPYPAASSQTDADAV